MSFKLYLFMDKQSTTYKHKGLATPLIYFIYLFIVWSLYRANFKFSDTTEELYIKPIVWFLPFFYIIPREKLKLSDLGITLKNLFPSVYISIALGVGFAFLGLIANITKYKGLEFNANIGSLFFGGAIVLSFITSLTEEIVFRGYLLSDMVRKLKNEYSSIILTTVLWTLIHMPIAYYQWSLSGIQFAVFLLLTFAYGFGASVLFLRTKNIAAPVILHVLWEWPIILFR